MVTRPVPVEVATSSRLDPTQSTQTSNLTSALRTGTGNENRPTSAVDVTGPSRGLGSENGGNTSESQLSSGAQPISVNAPSREKPRRESLAGSMVTGMSWGGNSVGSWIRDDIIMQGTSPFAYKSPSFHSSSYLPKLEANFMRDFFCCDAIYPSLHELLQHYEEVHQDSVPPSLKKQKSNQNNPPPDARAARAAVATSNIQQGGASQRPTQIDTTATGQATPQRSSTPVTPRQSQAQQVTRGFAPAPQSHPQDDDGVEDMDMEMGDDYGAGPSNPVQDQARITQPSQFGQPLSNRVTPLNLSTLNMGNPMHSQYQGLRNSQPTTPVSAGRSGNMYHHNPTVSSVNTPTLSTYNNPHPLQQSYYTPQSSAPGSPGELDGDFVGSMGDMNMGGLPYMQNQPYGGIRYGNGNDMIDLCIDEPAKRLFTLNGGLSQTASQVQAPNVPTSASQLGDGQYTENSEIAKTIRAEQKRAGVPDPSADGGIPKPFHCPVIGCEKAYKNQNGLKYHKSHGHNQQKLAANENGTFSIVDPDTLERYPGSLGMAKHKPYRCDDCGKRYKNLNGLKYHKLHAPQCPSEIQTPVLPIRVGEGTPMAV